MNGNGNGALGVNIWWTCASDFKATQKAVKEALEMAGVDVNLFNWPSNRALVSRAVYSMQDRRRKNDRRIVECAWEDDFRVVYGVLNRDVNGSEVAYGQNTTVELEKASGALSVSGDMADKVREAVDSFRDMVTDRDLRVFLRRVVRRSQGIAKRPSGGIYFVPLARTALVEQAASVIDRISGGKARLYVERVYNGEQERKNVWDSVEAEVAEAVEEAMKRCRKLGKQVGAAKGYADEVAELKALVSDYETLLGTEAKAETLRNKLAEAEAEVAAKIAELENSAA